MAGQLSCIGSKQKSLVPNDRSLRWIRQIILAERTGLNRTSYLRSRRRFVAREAITAWRSRRALERIQSLVGMCATMIAAENAGGECQTKETFRTERTPERPVLFWFCTLRSSHTNAGAHGTLTWPLCCAAASRQPQRCTQPHPAHMPTIPMTPHPPLSGTYVPGSVLCQVKSSSYLHRRQNSPPRGAGGLRRRQI